MKKICLKTALILALGSCLVSNLEAKKIIENLQSGNGAIIVPGARYAPGSYVYVGPNATGNTAGYTYVKPGSYLDGTGGANQDSTVVTETQVTRVATQAQVNMISDRISNVLDGKPSGSGTVALLNDGGGKNAGAMDKRFGIWARGTWNKIKDSTSGGNWDADLWSMALGGDYKFTDNILAGLAVTYGRLNGKTDFNKGNIHDDAYGVTPYVAIRANQYLSFDALGGYSYVSKKRDRKTSATNNVNENFDGPTVSSSPKSDRYFVSAYANLKYAIKLTDFLARIGILHAEDHQKAFSESDGGRYTTQTTRLSQAQLRLEVGHMITAMARPYIFGTYAYDMAATKVDVPDVVDNASKITYNSPNKQRNKNTFGGGLGLGITASQALSGGIEGSYAQNKKLKDYGVMLRVRYQF